METFAKGSVVLVSFPFSDLSNSKVRPALVITQLAGDDLVLCQITSKYKTDNYSISLTDNDFSDGGLQIRSWIKPHKLFTIAESIVDSKLGTLKKNKIKEVEEKLVQILTK